MICGIISDFCNNRYLEKNNLGIKYLLLLRKVIVFKRRYCICYRCKLRLKTVPKIINTIFQNPVIGYIVLRSGGYLLSTSITNIIKLLVFINCRFLSGFNNC